MVILVGLVINVYVCNVWKYLWKMEGSKVVNELGSNNTLAVYL